MLFIHESQNQINIPKLQKLQDNFCNATHVFIFCVDSSGKKLTELSGNKEEGKRIAGVLNDERLAIMLERVMGSEIEEQAVEDTADENIKVACISVKVKGQPVVNWIVCGIISGVDTGYRYVISEFEFYEALNLLRIASNIIFSGRHMTFDAQAESRRSKSSEIEMNMALRKSEAMTEIVQLLESDDGIEKVISTILKQANSIVDMSHSYVISMNRDHVTVDIIGEYVKEGQETLFPVKRGMQKPSFISDIDRTVVFTGETKVSDAMRANLREYGIRAITIMPIYINNFIAMYACFAECQKMQGLGVEDIKFLNDVTKIIQNIIVKRIQKNSIAGSYASLEAILDNVGSAIYVKDCDTKEVLFVNKIMKETFLDEMEAGTLDRLLEWGKRRNESTGELEIYYEEKQRWYDLNYTFINWVDGRRVALCALYDISDKKLYQKKIEQQANNDFLTGLYNRMCCEKDLAKYIEQSKQSGRRGALLYLDLDDFKHINDGLGHQYGDVLLKAISHSLQRIEGIEDTCYRMGGDEFVIIVPEESFDAIDDIMEGIVDIFSKPWFLRGSDYYCTMSMGLVTFPDQGDSVQDLIKKSDIAMYEAKKSGKNRISRYAQESDSLAYRRLDMEKNMRDATAANSDYREFEVYYQPIVDVQKPGCPCVGAEALIRWNNAELGFISPADFIPLAEYLGLINPIGNHVLRKACMACRNWNENGHPYYKVNVNLSVVQLLQNDIVETIGSIIKETGINPRNLTLEVTEGLAINDMERMKQVLSEIRGLGARIALDDFGTGYSSLNHIREIPLDVIKVDQSFVRDLAINQYAQSFIKMVAELAEAIGVRVCVEGIETEDQLKAVEGMKVRLVQGFFFERPMKLKEFEEKYARKTEDLILEKKREMM